MGGNLAWADRPTISYAPVSGQEFSRNLLTPLPPGALREMMQSGWPATEELGRDVRKFQELLGLDPELHEFRVTYGLIPGKPGDIAVLTGSIWDIMLDLAWQFEVPDGHIASGRTESSFSSDHARGVPPIRVSFSEEKPEDAFVSVRAQGYWFFIDQHDGYTKRAFSFLQLLLNLAETSTPDRSPVVTISN